MIESSRALGTSAQTSSRPRPSVEDLQQINAALSAMSAEQRVAWSLQYLPAQAVLSSSFGIQSAVLLHMLTQQQADIPVIVTDTGYLFPETYQFIEELTQRLRLNLKVHRHDLSPAWQEAKFGQLWHKGETGLRQYNKMNKLEPMQRAMQEHKAGTWFSGIRAGQSSSRADKQLVEISTISGEHSPIYKVHPILDWSNRDIHQYLTNHALPYHPLWEQGYVSVGDVHTSRKLEPGMTEEQTLFFGLMRECGLHENIDGGGI
jgi:phosphoadenosine phosphosulfate reductase